MNGNFRFEKDSFGEIELSEETLWGSNTERARLNLTISSQKMPYPLIYALAKIKAAYANAAAELGFLEPRLAGAIERAAIKIARGDFDEHFPLDCYQTGSGTSTNMNVNEVISNLANIELGGKAGDYKPIHPNDHANFGQSSNDVMPAALHLAALSLLRNRLLPSLELLAHSWEMKALKYSNIVKTGRTHMQDALPITFGHVFRGYGDALYRLKESLAASTARLCIVPLGGTAVGTGFQAPEGLAERSIARLKATTGFDIKLAPEPLAFMAGRPLVTELMGGLAALSAELNRIANDTRLMASGPRLGFGEIKIPALQPGSSIMPGKVNPVVCEAVTQTFMSVQGYHATVLSASAIGGQFELNAALPVAACALLGAIELLSNAMNLFREKLVEGLEVNEKRAGEGIERSLAMATALISSIGYAKAAEVAKKASDEDITVAQAAIELGILTPKKAGEILNPEKMVKKTRVK